MMNEINIYVINCDESQIDFRQAEYVGDSETIISEAERQGGVYSLQYFQDEINSENLNLSNSFIFIKNINTK